MQKAPARFTRGSFGFVLSKKQSGIFVKIIAKSDNSWYNKIYKWIK